MDKIDIRDMILKTLKENKIEVDNFNDAVFEDDFLKVAETIVKNLPIYVVSQQRELFADQDSREFILWQRDRDITRLENGKYKWREFEYDRNFFLEKYLEYINKANCG